MTRYRALGVFFASALGVLTAPAARAASLQQVTDDWKGGTSFPSDVYMYIYVPDKVAANPPLLVLTHFCGGSACDVFNQAKGNGTTNGGVIQAADKYGFIIVVPSNAPPSKCAYPNGRCWDVTSSKAQTRDGGGDTHAIKQMVKYALDKYKANPERVYATGDSSGAMTTELLLALYPDIFKAGSAFAGVPAGCSNIFDGSGLCGLPAQTAQQWGDRVRAMYKGYSGHRPRVQLVHGDADTTITSKNLPEAVKEWTNVLGLSTDPTSKQGTSAGLTLGTHQATRESWKNTCGYTVLDALTSIGGDHGPSDALFEAQYVIPFLALDKTDAVDPEIAQCGNGSDAGAGGAGGSKDAGSGGSTGAGGSATGGSNAGGSTSSGGSSGNGGATSAGGSQSSGGSAQGGSQGSGGAVSSGGTSSTGGSSAKGGTSGSSGGAAGSSTGGGGSNGCTCALGGQQHENNLAVVLGLALGLTMLVRRRGRASR